MILTHFLVLMASPTSLVAPAAALLPMTSADAVLRSGRLNLALVPALAVRAAPPVLPVRER
ncbi:hypothetical protein [Sandarakinorhabdus oryzae]|uniref:hypothetical protein n=1 Tax=Sandarakinorhabdus oryzae TaxID=2675220 RepID=UPI0012E1412F|nr:hypothetical protein [Sandarakinorhabdus oryzae]